MISDLILSLFAFQIFFQIKGMNKKWSLFFLFMGFSALIGGIYHGFSAVGEQYRFLSWAFLSVSLIYAILAAYSKHTNITFITIIFTKSILLLTLSIYNSDFIYMVLDTSITMFGFIVIGNIVYLKSLSGYITNGILLSIISAFFVITRTSFHSQYLTYNDIGHYITILSLLTISKGIRKDYYKQHNHIQPEHK